MKIFYVIACLYLVPVVVNGQEDSENIYIVKLEVLKPIGWLQTNGFVLEPGLSMHQNNWVYSVIFGLNNINDEVYRQLDYNNNGWYLQGGVQYRAISFGNGLTGLYFGLHANFAEFREKGTIVFEGEYFDDYKAVLKQKNTAFGVNWLTSTKFELSKRVQLDLTARISQVITDFHEPHYPVYYVPGMGVINFFENRRNGWDRTTVGVSIKIGYIIN